LETGADTGYWLIFDGLHGKEVLLYITDEGWSASIDANHFASPSLVHEYQRVISHSSPSTQHVELLGFGSSIMEAVIDKMAWRVGLMG
jgi:hypothetical protein